MTTPLRAILRLYLALVSTLLFVSVASGQVTTSDPSFTVTLLKSGLSGPGNAAVFRAPSGDVVVSENGAGRVSTVDAASGATTTFVSVATPDEIAVRSSDGVVAVKTHPGGPVTFYDSTGTTVLGTIAAGSPDDCISGLAFDDGGNLFVAAGPRASGDSGCPSSSQTGWNVYEFAGPTPWTVAPSALIDGSVNALEGLTFFGGNLYAISSTSGKLYQIAPPFCEFCNFATTIATVPNAGRIAFASVNFGGTGYTTGDTVTVTGGGGSGGKLSVTAAGGVVTGVSIVTAGSGYTDFTGAGTSAIAPSTGTGLSVNIITATTQPKGIAVDPVTQDIYVSEFLGSMAFPGQDILRLDFNGEGYDLTFQSPPFATGFTNPIGLGFDNGGCLYAADNGTGDLWKFCPKTQTATLTFSPGADQSQIATFNCPLGPPCTNPDAHSIKFTVTQVNMPFSITVTPFYVPTDLQLGTAGNGIGDGICETGANEKTDYDCRWTQFFLGPAVTAGTPPANPVSGNLVPQCYAYSDDFCVYYRVTGDPGPGFYSGFIYVYVGWNPTLLPRGTFASSYQTIPRMYDDPSNDTIQNGYPVIPGFPYSPENHQYVFDITAYYNPNPNQVGVDQGAGGRVPHFNDFAIAFPLTNAALGLPSYTYTWLLPTGNPVFENGNSDEILNIRFKLTPDTPPGIAVSAPHHVGVGVFSGDCSVSPSGPTNQPFTVPDGFPNVVKYNPTTGNYHFALLPAFPPGQYKVIVNSDLFLQQCANFRIAPQ